MQTVNMIIVIKTIGSTLKRTLKLIEFLFMENILRFFILSFLVFLLDFNEFIFDYNFKLLFDVRFFGIFIMIAPLYII